MPDLYDSSCVEAFMCCLDDLTGFIDVTDRDDVYIREFFPERFEQGASGLETECADNGISLIDFFFAILVCNGDLFACHLRDLPAQSCV